MLSQFRFKITQTPTDAVNVKGPDKTLRTGIVAINSRAQNNGEQLKLFFNTEKNEVIKVERVATSQVRHSDYVDGETITIPKEDFITTYNTPVNNDLIITLEKLDPQQGTYGSAATPVTQSDIELNNFIGKKKTENVLKGTLCGLVGLAFGYGIYFLSGVGEVSQNLSGPPKYKYGWNWFKTNKIPKCLAWVLLTSGFVALLTCSIHSWARFGLVEKIQTPSDLTPYPDTTEIVTLTVLPILTLLVTMFVLYTKLK
tara:strand:- start:226 stop:993 length:768 start_codon:yes stop_codon:yes gene_type:complete